MCDTWLLILLAHPSPPPPPPLSLSCHDGATLLGGNADYSLKGPQTLRFGGQRRLGR